MNENFESIKILVEKFFKKDLYLCMETIYKDCRILKRRILSVILLG